MRKYITQMLEDINADTKAIENYKNDAALKIIFEYAFDPEKKMNLPEGAPPYKLSVEPLGMTPTNLFSELRRLYVFNRADLTPFRRESLFVSLLEGVHPSEADMLIAVKDQVLSKLYPKITHKLVYESGFISTAPVAKEKKVAAKKVVAPKTGAKV